MVVIVNIIIMIKIKIKHCDRVKRRWGLAWERGIVSHHGKYFLTIRSIEEHNLIVDYQH